MNASRQELKPVPALPDLFEVTEDGARIMSARCGTCGTCFFPKYHQQHRPGCSREGVEEILLAKRGTLASYTIQYYMPPPPFKTEKEITPYPIGLVEFPEGIQIAGIVVDCPHDKLKTGMPVDTTTFTLYRNEEGQPVLTWAFRPAK